jgi:hypothetical protein
MPASSAGTAATARGATFARTAPSPPCAAGAPEAHHHGRAGPHGHGSCPRGNARGGSTAGG